MTLERRLAESQARFQALVKELRRVIVGHDEAVRGTLISLLCGGHVLLEGVPGLGKTLLVKTLGQLLGLKFSRIQFTPDLMPADILGTNIIMEDESGRRYFEFARGPIFAHIVLADEINRATPKTQSALLEAMQERSVTVGGRTYPLEEPFIVLATQNPIEMEGSLPLDEIVLAGDGLVRGEELLQKAQTSGVTLIDGKGARLYQLPELWSYTLDSDSDSEVQIRLTRCGLYQLPYRGRLIKIRTKTGRELRVTEDHPFLVNEQGELRWKRAKELCAGDFLVCPARLPEGLTVFELMSHDEALARLSTHYTVVRHAELCAIRRRSENWCRMDRLNSADFDRLRIASFLTKKELAGRLGLDPNGYGRLVRFLRGRSKDVRIRTALERYFAAHPPDLREEYDFIESFTITRLKPFPVDEEVAAWLGFLLAEGAIGVGTLAVYQKTYARALEAFIRTTEEKLGLRISALEERAGTRAVILRSKPFVEYLNLRFGVAKGKGIPSWILGWPASLRRAFLRTFIGLESHLDPAARRITVSQKDRGSVNVLVHLLLQEGLLPWIKPQGRIYRLILRGEDYDRFLKEIGWIEVEGAKLPQIVNSLKGPHHSSHRVVPISGEKLRNLVRGLNLKGLSQRRWYNAYRYACRRDLISERKLKELIEDLQRELPNPSDFLDLPYELKALFSLFQRFRALASEWIFHDRIREVQGEPHYQGDVFGLTVPGSQNYVAGFGACGLSHNTYPLPEAQVDRFFFKVLLRYPSPEELDEILVRNLTALESEAQLPQVLTREELLEARRLVAQIPLAEPLRHYIVRLVVATHPHAEEAPPLVRQYVEYGASPRAGLALLWGAKANAFLEGQINVRVEDIRRIFLPALRHRIIRNFRGEAEGVSPEEILQQVLERVPEV